MTPFQHSALPRSPPLRPPGPWLPRLERGSLGHTMPAECLQSLPGAALCRPRATRFVLPSPAGWAEAAGSA